MRVLRVPTWRHACLLTVVCVVFTVLGCGTPPASPRSEFHDLFVLAMEGDVEGLRDAKEQLDLAGVRCKRGQNLLHTAGTAEVVGFLMAEDVDPGHICENGWTPLHSLAQWGRAESVEALLSAGVPADQKSSRNSSVMGLHSRRHAAAGEDTPGELLFGCAAGDCTALHAAAAGGGTPVVALLVERGLSPDVEGAYGLRPLHEAVRMGRLEAARLLVELGADVNAETRSGVTPRDLIPTDSELISDDDRDELQRLLQG